MLENNLKEQLNQYFELLESDLVLKVSLGSDEKSQEMKAFLEEIVALTSKITIQEEKLTRTPSFKVSQKIKTLV